MAMYKVEAIKDRWIHGARETFKAQEGYVVFRTFLNADSKEKAIDQCRDYHILPGTDYDSISAELAQ